MVTMVYTTWLMTKTLLANPDSESKSSLAPRNPCFWQNFLRILFKEYFLSRVKYRMLVMISWSASKRDFNTISVNSKTNWKSWKNFAAFLSNFLFCWQLWFPNKNCLKIRENFLRLFCPIFYFVDNFDFQSQTKIVQIFVKFFCSFILSNFQYFSPFSFFSPFSILSEFSTFILSKAAKNFHEFWTIFVWKLKLSTK